MMSYLLELVIFAKMMMARAGVCFFISNGTVLFVLVTTYCIRITTSQLQLLSRVMACYNHLPIKESCSCMDGMVRKEFF